MRLAISTALSGGDAQPDTAQYGCSLSLRIGIVSSPYATVLATLFALGI